MAFCAAPLSSGRIAPRVTIGRITPSRYLHSSHVRDIMSTRYCRLFKDTTAYISASIDAGAASAPLLSGGARVRHWQSARRLWPDTRRLQLPLDDCCRRQYLLDISVGHFEPDRFGSFSRHTCIFYEYNWYAGNTFSNLTIFYSNSLAISNDLLSLALLKTSHFILYQLIVWLFGMVCQISLSGIVN